MSKKIPLTQGKFAIVDDEDFERVSQFNWHYSNNGYAVRKKNKKTFMMHRFILGDMYCKNGLEVDHRNRDGLDNRKENIWFCTRQENSRNCKLFSNNKSGYRGVSWDKDKKKWRATITVNGKGIKLGRRKTPEEASELYLDFVRKEFG